jgi:hypothetical protein
VAHGALRLHPQPVDAEPLQRRADVRRVRARVEQGAEQHVARDAGEAVEVERPRHAAAPAERAIRAAIVPAPKPSSMFTTATPAAHEHSMDSSAVTPENAAP